MLTKPLIWLLMQYLPPRAHVLPLILRPTSPGRPLSPQLPALPRVMTANTAATPGTWLLRRSFLPIRTWIVPLLHCVHPAASATTNPVARPAPKKSTSLPLQVEEQVSQLQSQLARLKNQAGPPKPTTAYKATPSEPFLDESEPREYGLHARTRLSIGFYRSA